MQQFIDLGYRFGIFPDGIHRFERPFENRDNTFGVFIDIRGMDLYRCDQSFDAGERILRYSLSGSGLTVLLRSAGFLVDRKSVLFCNAAELFPQTIEIVLLIHDARNQRFHRFAPLSETALRRKGRSA